jgi:hypothetical protein
VFWLCDFTGEPGAETTPFTNAGYDCPGDDDLEHELSGEALAGHLTRRSASSRDPSTDGRSTISRRSFVAPSGTAPGSTPAAG